MLYKKPVLKPFLKENLAAFSLVEVLMTLLLIALVLISVAPIITKRSASRNIEGVVFTYKGNNVTQNNKCFLTSQLQYADAVGHSEWLSTAQTGFLTTKECSEYEFTPPSGVKTVNLTLVAGGGGGGGAAGGTLLERTVTSKDAGASSGISISDAYRDEIRKINIDYLVGSGQDGKEKNTEVISDCPECVYNLLFYFPNDVFYNNLGKYSGSYNYASTVYVYPGDGGMSSSAIYDYEVPPGFYRFEHKFPSAAGSNLKNILSESIFMSYYPQYKYGYYELQENGGNLFKYAATYPGHDGSTVYDIACGVKDSIYSTCTSTGCAFNKSCVIPIPKNNVLTSQSGKSTVNAIKTLGTPVKDKSGVIFNKNYSYGLKKGGEGGVLPKYSNYGKGGRGQGIIAKFTSCNEAPLKEKINPETGETTYVDPYSRGKGKFDSCDSINKLTYEEKVSKYCSKASEDEVATCINNLSNYCGKVVTDVVYLNCPVEETTSGSNNWSGKAGGPFFGKITYTIERPGGTGGGGSGAAYVQIKNFPVENGAKYIIRVGKGGDGGKSGQYGYLNGATNNSTKGQNGTGGVTSSIWKKEGDNETLIYMVIGGTGGQGGQIYGKNQDGDITINNTPYINDDAYQRSKGNPGKIVPVLFYGGNEPTNNTFGTDKISLLKDNNLCSDISFFGAAGINIQSVCLSYSNLLLSANTPYSYLNTDLNLGATSNSQYNLSGFSNYKTPSDTNKTKTINGTSYLSSYYYRTLVGDQIGYVGGLGGFSGLGGKAGCGGLFIGNPNGFNGNNSSPQYNTEGAKKLFLSGNSISEISDFYENCTSDTPNGQSATFVAPSPQKRTLGQAGAGGGGGGYTMFYGGGNGGRGQNGYVMIDWRK